jgi:glycosyltransferase involved in cell wall biosynthesis
MQPLRLCFIVESGTDVRLVEGLADVFDLSLIARQIVNGVEISHPPAVSVPTELGSPSRLGFAYAVWNYLNANKSKIDVVLVQGYSLAALAANLAARTLGLKVVQLVCSPTEAYYLCRLHYPTANKPFLNRELQILKLLAALNARLAQHYVVLSDYLRSVVLSHGVTCSIDNIPIYGVDTTIFSPCPGEKAQVKEQLGLPSQGKIIFFSSRIAPEKDSETLLTAFKELLDAGYDLWLLHRSGGYKSFIEDAQRFGIAERVIATDAVHPHKQLPLDYQACDLCIQASREEGLGFSVLEALACEVPVVATSVGGLKETIRDGETGWNYPVADVETLVKTISTILEQPEEAQRRAKLGREMVNQQFSRTFVFEKFRDLCRQIVNKSNR